MTASAVDKKVKMILDKLKDCKLMFSELKGERTTKQWNYRQSAVDKMNAGICEDLFDGLIHNIEQEY